MHKPINSTHPLRRAGSLLLIVVLLISMVPPVSAASYSYTVSSGAQYTLNVGDVLYLSKPQSSSGMAFYNYYWGSNKGIIDLDDYGQSATVTAMAPGTVQVTATLSGSYPVTNYGQRYNSVTKQWETYTYTTYRQQIYETTVTVTINDTLPPEIVSQPKNCSVPIGGTASTTFSVTDHSSISYIWHYADPGDTDWQLSSVTGATYACKMTEAKSGRRVICIAEDALGNSIISDVAYLGVLGISSQPTNSVVALGKTAKTSVTAYGDGLNYQWYIKDPGSSAFTKSSVTSSTYGFSMTAAKSGRQVYCVVTDKYGGSVKTNTVTMRAEDYIKITKQPTNAVAASGKTVSTSVTATGDGLTYQWYTKDPGGSSFGKSSIKESTYSYTMSLAKSGRQVYCVITDKYGNTAKTNTVTLSLLAITQQPANVAVAAGETASTTVTVSGSGLKYQWYVKDPGSSSFGKSSVTGKTYGYVMTEAKSGRQVYCVIADKYGNSVRSNTVTLKIPSYAKITKQPANAIVASGKTVSTSVTATGDGLTYQWYVKDPGKSSFYKSSVTGSTYGYAMTEAKSGRQAYCVITDAYGTSVKTNTVTLRMAAPIALTSQPVDTTVAYGNTASVTVAASGEGTLTYQWYVKNPSDTGFSKSAITGPTYAIVMDSSGRSGRQVYCVITDNYGQQAQSNTVTLRQAAKISISRQPRDIYGLKGEYYNFSVSASGTGTLTYTWYFSRPEYDDDYFVKSSEKSKDYYQVRANLNNDGFRVYCVISDAYGQSVTSNIATLYVS